MKRLLLILALCASAFGQTTSLSSNTQLAGNAQLSAKAASGGNTGGPLNYSARQTPDNCVHGYSTNPPTVAPFYNPAYETCTPGATTGQSGSGLIFQAGASDPLPFLRLDDATTPAVANTSYTDPDFGSYSIFVTDPSTNGLYGTSWNLGSGGGYDAFGTGQSDGSDTLLSFQNGGSVPYFTHIIESRFLGHTCSTTNKCVIVSNIHGASCDPGSTCTSTQITSSGSNTFSRNPNNPPNTLFEFYHGKMYKDTWTSSLASGFPNGTSDSVTRTLLVDLTSDNGGSIPCSILPAGYNVRWTSILDFADDDSFTLAIAGGGPWVANATVTTDTFIQPVNNVSGIQYYMFQYTTPGTAGNTEPLWSTNCPAKGNTCTDGTAVATNIGSVNGQGPGFDVVHFDPHRGCSRDNTRVSKRYRGTNEGPNWPSAGTPDTAGQWTTDDAVVGYRMSGSSYTPGTFVNLTDQFTLHAAGSYLDSRYGHIGPTNGGGINNTFGNGSCTPAVPYTYFPGWPNNIAWSSTYNTPTGYTTNNYVVSPIDHNYYKYKAGTGLTADPSTDPTDWTFVGSLCYNYIADWYSNVMRINTEIGPGYGGDGHSAIGYVYDWRGGTYWSHLLSQPNCNTTTGSCSGLNVGHPNPNIQALTLSLPNDGHPTYRNDGKLDLQPIIDPTFSAPSWGGVNLMPSCYGAGGTSGYCSAGYGEMLAFSTDGLQTLYRFGHNFNTGSNPGFGTQSDIGVVDQHGRMLAWSGDFMNTRGDGPGASTTCANPLRGQYAPSSGQCVSLNDYVFPPSNTNNTNQSVYKITSLGSAVQGSCAVGQVTEGTVPAWTGCQAGASTCTDSFGIVFTNENPNSCRPDIGLMDLLSAKPVSANTLNVQTACGAAGNGTTDDTAAINTCISRLAPGYTLLFPAGTYKVTSQLTISASSIIIDGSNGTATLKCNSTSGWCLQLGNSSLTGSNRLTADSLVGSTSFTATSLSAIGVVAGSYVELSEGGVDVARGITDPTSCSTATPCRSEIVKVLSVASNTANLDTTAQKITGLHWPFHYAAPADTGCVSPWSACPLANNAVVYRVQIPTTGITLQNIILDGTGGSNEAGLYLLGLMNSTISGVTIQNFVNEGIGGFWDYNDTFSSVNINAAGNDGGHGAFNIKNSGHIVVNGMIFKSMRSNSWPWFLGGAADNIISNVEVDGGGVVTTRMFNNGAISYSTFNNLNVHNASTSSIDNNVSIQYYAQYLTFINSQSTVGGTTAGWMGFGNDNSFNTFINCSASGNTGWAMSVGRAPSDDANWTVDGGTWSGLASPGNDIFNFINSNHMIENASISGPGGWGINFNTVTNSCINGNTFAGSSGLASGGIYKSTASVIGSGNTMNGNSSNLTAGTCGLSVSPSTLAFGSHAVGSTSSPLMVTLTNNTASSITVDKSYALGDYILLSSSCGTLASGGGSCSISVSFTPQATGSRNSYLIAYPVDIGGTAIVALTGSGT